MVIMQKKSRNLNLKFNINEALAVYQALSSIVYGNTLSADFNIVNHCPHNKTTEEECINFGCSLIYIVCDLCGEDLAREVRGEICDSCRMDMMGNNSYD